MQCNNCGRELSNEDVFCSNCGAPVNQNVNADISAHFENANGGPVQSVDPNQNVVVAATNPANINSTPVVSSVEQTPPPVTTNVAVETVTTVNATPAVETQVQPQVEQQNVLTPPEDKYITDNSENQIEYNVGRQTTFVSGVTDTSSVMATAASTEQPQTVVETTNTVEQTTASTQPSYDSVTFGPAPIIDPPVAPEYNNVAVSTPVYNVKQSNGLSMGAIVAIIAAAAFVFLGAGLGVGFLLFSSAKVNTGGEEVEPKPLSSSEVVDVNFGGSKFSIPDKYDYDLDEEKLAIYNEDIYFYIMTAPAKYSQYLANIPYLKTHYADLGYTISSASEEKVGDQRYIILNVSNPSGKVSIFIRQFGSNTSLTGAIARTDDSYATSKDLSDVEAILSSGSVSRAIAPSKNSKKLENELLKGIIEADFEESKEDTSKEKVEDTKEIKEESDKE